MNEIEHVTPLSKGTVNNIIQDWKASINGTDIEDIRGFIVEVRKSGMALLECAQAFRVANILGKMGVYDEVDESTAHNDDDYYYDHENKSRLQKQVQIRDVENNEQDKKAEFTDIKDNQTTNLLDLIRSASSPSQDNSKTHYTKPKRFENNKITSGKGNHIAYFVNTIYKNCKLHGIKPSILIDWILDLFHFYSVLSEQSMKLGNNYSSHQNNNANENTFPKGEQLDDEISNEIPLVSRVTFFIEQRYKEIHNLVNEKNTIIEEINKLSEQKSKVQANLSNTVEEEKRAFSYLQWFNTLKQELHDKFNIAIELEFEAFARAISDFRGYDFNALQIMTEYKDFVSLREQKSLMKKEIDLNNQTRQHLLNDINQLKDQAYSYRQTMKTFYQLQQIGFGLPKLKELNGLITEVSTTNNIDPSEAVTRFFREIEKNYDSKLGLESKIKEMEDEYELLKNKVAENQRSLAIQNPIAPNLAYLYSQGLTNDDIKGITDLVVSLSNSYLLDYKSIKKDNTIYANKTTNSEDLIDKKEFWKIIIKKFKDLKSINSEIEQQRQILKELEAMKELDKQEDNPM